MEARKTGCPSDPRRVWWDEKDCERMTRHEFQAVQSLLGAVIYIANASEDLQKRLECIPAGKQRMAMAKGAVAAIANDLIGTMTVAQCKQMQNVMKDMDMRMVPKMSPSCKNVIMTADHAKTLIDSAKAKCDLCTASGTEIRACPLYKTLEAVVPLENYGDGLICPYVLAEWEG